jgi:hypothetical protein
VTAPAKSVEIIVKRVLAGMRISINHSHALRRLDESFPQQWQRGSDLSLKFSGWRPWQRMTRIAHAGDTMH